jgi:TatD DNase family protein
MRFYDAHNHLQDERFGRRQTELLSDAVATGVVGMVVNGACAADWPMVAALARSHTGLIPAFGWHPWYLHEREAGWLEELELQLARFPAASVGEIGLDRWILEQPASVRSRYQPDLGERAPASIEEQAEAFVAQWKLAVRLDRAVTIHCLNAWGRLIEIIKAIPGPSQGFLLHSYGGSAELVPELTRMGAYFGFPGYFALDRKQRQREVFRRIPIDRLLVETDAPDQLPPASLIRFPLYGPEPERRNLNHPANLSGIYAYLADWLAIPLPALESQVELNFRRLFGSSRQILEPPPP